MARREAKLDLLNGDHDRHTATSPGVNPRTASIRVLYARSHRLVATLPGPWGTTTRVDLLEASSDGGGKVVVSSLIEGKEVEFEPR